MRKMRENKLHFNGYLYSELLFFDKFVPSFKFKYKRR